MRFFQEVPEPAASSNHTSSAGVLVLDEGFTQCLGLAANVVVDSVSPFCVAVLAARLDEQFVDAPVVQLIRHSDLLDPLPPGLSSVTQSSLIQSYDTFTVHLSNLPVVQVSENTFLSFTGSRTSSPFPVVQVIWTDIYSPCVFHNRYVYSCFSSSPGHL